MIKINYVLDSDDMSDEQYENQEEREFIITQEMLMELMEEHIHFNEGEYICPQNFYIEKIK